MLEHKFKKTNTVGRSVEVVQFERSDRKVEEDIIFNFF